MAIKATRKGKGTNKATGRDYTKELEYQKRPEQVRNRVARNRARREMIKKHGKAALKGKDVGHTSMLAKSKNPDKVGYKIESRAKNRGKDNKNKPSLKKGKK